MELLAGTAGARRDAYGCSLLAHSLQCAALAAAEDGTPEMVLAALLHDIGTLVAPLPVGTQDHAGAGALLLAHWFPPSVVEPVRLHVTAKRYLAAADPSYARQLSVAGRATLRAQGGPLAVPACREFVGRSWAHEALVLRGWDDRARDPEAATPPLADFTGLLDVVGMLPSASASAISPG